MQNAFVNILVILIAGILLGSSAMAQPVIDRPDSTTIAIIPFVNYSGNAAADSIFGGLIHNRLASYGFNLIEKDSLRNTMRRYRIRAVGEIGSDDIDKIANEFKVDYYLLGSYNNASGGIVPEASITIRMLSAETKQIVWSSGVSLTGDDNAGLFDVNKLDDLESLAEDIVNRVFDDFAKQLLNKYNHQVRPLRLAVITFDNGSEFRLAGNIVRSIFENEIFNNGYKLLEPGFVSELLRNNNKVTRGEITVELARKLREIYQIDYILTGTVDQFALKAQGVEYSTPTLGFGVRTIDASTGQMIDAEEYHISGDDAEKILSWGICNSIGELTSRTTQKYLNRINGKLKDYANNK